MTLQFDNLKQFPHLSHFVSTRQGGVSQPPFDQLNLSYAVKDSAEAVRQNREILAQAVGFAVQQLCVPQQTHSSHVQVVTRMQAGQGATNYESGLAATDGLLTVSTDLCLLVFSADCVLTLLYDRKNHVAGAVHGGWRGTVKKIAAQASWLMQSQFGSAPEDIWVGIAPAIGVCCYEVGNEVADTFATSFAYKDDYMKKNTQTDKYHLDLQGVTKRQLVEETGLLANQIEIMPICTACHADKFFSSRKGQGVTGRFAAGILLKQPTSH